jgi:hypothetical protein
MTCEPGNCILHHQIQKKAKTMTNWIESRPTMDANNYLKPSKTFTYEKKEYDRTNAISEVELNQSRSSTWPEDCQQWQLTLLTNTSDTSKRILQQLADRGITTSAWVDNGGNLTCHGDQTPSSNTMSDIQNVLDFLNRQDDLDDEIMQLLCDKMKLNTPEKTQRSTIANEIDKHVQRLTTTDSQQTIRPHLPLIEFAQAAQSQGNVHAIPLVVDFIEHHVTHYTTDYCQQIITLIEATDNDSPYAKKLNDTSYNTYTLWLGCDIPQDTQQTIREQRLKALLTMDESQQTLIDIAYCELCGFNALDDSERRPFENTTGDADTLIQMAKLLRAQKNEIDELKSQLPDRKRPRPGMF